MSGPSKRIPNRAWALLIYVVAGASAIGCSSVLAFPSNTTQLVGLGGALGFVLTVVAALFYLTSSWPLSRLLAPLPLVISLSLAWLSFGSGRPIGKWWFNNDVAPCRNRTPKSKFGKGPRWRTTTMEMNPATT